MVNCAQDNNTAVANKARLHLAIIVTERSDYQDTSQKKKKKKKEKGKEKGKNSFNYEVSYKVYFILYLQRNFTLKSGRGTRSLLDQQP